MSTLLTREEFREQCLNRDGHKCVSCKELATEVHHIYDRKLYVDGGYYKDNGASVCNACHMKCETTDISVEEVLQACGIKNRVLPEHLDPDTIYDKWGNPVMPNGMRLKGEMFYEESVQKILFNKLYLFTHYVKYPKSMHFWWSENLQNDDRVISSLNAFIGKRVIATIKYDGEGTNCYNDYIHARSIGSGKHLSRDWMHAFWATFRYDIPEGWRVCGENCYAVHSIKYDDLPSYFMGFSVWDDKNICLGWDDTLEWFELLGITPVKVIYDGIWDEDKIKSLWNPQNKEKIEGYVVRVADSFKYSEFKYKLGKFVRKSHVVSDSHWMYKKMEVNKLVK
jgi:hypothetical protein